MYIHGLEIPTLLYRPARPNGAAIPNPHGGPTGQSLYDWDILAQYYLAKGYTYLAPNYRGSKLLLIVHGLEDTICPAESTAEWVEVLRRAGKTFEYKTYAGEPHNFLKRENLLDVYRRMERFLDWYLLP